MNSEVFRDRGSVRRRAEENVPPIAHRAVVEQLPPELQRPGKAAQAADAFLRGFALPAGTVLPSPAVLSLGA